MTESIPTAKQIAFAMCLGIKLPQGITSEEVSEKISKALEKADEQDVNAMQKQLAKLWDIDLDEVETRGDASQDLWDTWEDDPSLPALPSFEDRLMGVSKSKSKKADKQGCLVSLWAMGIKGCSLVFWAVVVLSGIIWFASR